SGVSNTAGRHFHAHIDVGAELRGDMAYRCGIAKVRAESSGCQCGACRQFPMGQVAVVTLMGRMIMLLRVTGMFSMVLMSGVVVMGRVIWLSHRSSMMRVMVIGGMVVTLDALFRRAMGNM